MSWLGSLEAVWKDIRYAWRTMRQRPGFSATAVFTLALAIGGTTVMFTVIRAVLMKPLQYRDPDRLVRISGGATPARFREMQAAARSFTGIGAYAGWEDLTLSGGAEPEVLRGAYVSHDFLRILGAEPLLGRGFRPEEDAPGGAPVALISAELWRRRFGADPRIVGRTATLADTPYTIIGVLPPRFQFPYAGLDVWMTAPTEWASIPPRSRALSPYLTLFARLKPGVSLAQADPELRVIRHQYAMSHPANLDARDQTPAELMPLKDSLVANVRIMLWMLFGAAGFVLLIACANVAGLLLARATSRTREFAVRAALGAGRSRLIRQLLAESVLLSLAGGLLGVLLAAYGLRAIPSIGAFHLPRASEVRPDWMVLAFAAALSLGTGLIFGLAPSLGASRPDLFAALRTSGAASAAGGPPGILARLRPRTLLLVGQVALSVVLLIGAALLMASVARMRHLDIGFAPANLLTMNVSLPPVRYNSDPKTVTFFHDLLARVKILPGARAATVAWYLPMMGYAGTPVQDAAKPPLPLNQRTLATLMIVTPGYFHTLGIPLRRGREFAEHDTADAQRVAIIDEALARRFWPAYPAGEDPIGQRLLIGGVNPKAAEIVGIAADVRQGLETSAWPEAVYTAFPQNAQKSAVLAVRTAGAPLSMTRAVKDEVRALDRDQSVAGISTMEDLVEQQVGQRRSLMFLLGAFAGVALLLAVIGIYGVIAYSVAQRTQEVGIRRALGAQQGDILRLVIRQGLVLSSTGILLGLLSAGALTRVMKTVLFHVSATDPWIYAGVALLFLSVGLAASYLPALRAARVDPMAALRI
ncbi:MAG TPA: ABC transporter permease [Bryobacteraceae bacterium]|nr:ABC transporter permease [Bryobacteraceae bacterium]